MDKYVEVFAAMKKSVLLFTRPVMVICVVILSSVVAYSFPGDGADDFLLDGPLKACTNIMVGKGATIDGSTIGSFSCDGPPFGAVGVEPRHTYSPGTMMPIYRFDMSKNVKQYAKNLKEKKLLGAVPQAEKTQRYIDMMVGLDPWHDGGMNECGLTIGDSTIGGRPELYNQEGILMTLSNETQRSLIIIALQRAKTAREAIKLIGSLAEEYGFYDEYFHGDHLVLTDGSETWSMEIFGCGSGWQPGSGKPGALWCAQRIPDDHIGVCANRSRIGEIDLDNSDYFMASPNVFSVAIENGWWDPESGEPFIWYRVYGSECGLGCILREWTVLNAAAPSLNLDPGAERFPFSVKPDKLLSVQDIMSMHRNALEGTPYDTTENPVFYQEGQKHPMACQWGPWELHRLLGIRSHGGIANPRAAFTFISEIRADLPEPIRGCLWLGLGPAATTCYVPVYSGVTRIPEHWSKTEPSRIDREDAWWAFNLVSNLSTFKYQVAKDEIEDVRNPVEAAFFAKQAHFERTITALYSQHPKSNADKRACDLVTLYTNSCMNAVADGYRELVDYLLIRLFFQYNTWIELKKPAIDLLFLQ